MGGRQMHNEQLTAVLSRKSQLCRTVLQARAFGYLAVVVGPGGSLGGSVSCLILILMSAGAF